MRLPSALWCSSHRLRRRAGPLCALCALLCAAPGPVDGRGKRARLASSQRGHSGHGRNRPTPLPEPTPGPVLRSTELLDEEPPPPLAPESSVVATPPPAPLPLLGAGTLAGEVTRALSRRLRAEQGLLEHDEGAALRFQVSLHCALSAGGRVVLRGVPPERLEQALATLAREDIVDRQALATLVNERFPLLLSDSAGWLWRRRGARYQRLPIGPSPLAAVDDLTGALYASDGGSDGAPLVVAGPGGAADDRWRSIGIRDARSIAASGGALYALLDDGRLLIHRPGESPSQIAPRALRGRGSLLAGGGALYLIDERSGLKDVYRLRDRAWDNHGDPIARGLRRVVGSGLSWYGVDQAGQLLWGEGERQVIDQDNDIADLWLWGRDLLVLTEDHHLYLFSAARAAWLALDG